MQHPSSTNNGKSGLVTYARKISNFISFTLSGKQFRTFSVCLLLAGTLLLGKPGGPGGAWWLESNDTTQVIILSDGYFTYTVYDRTSKKFLSTSGGPFTWADNKLVISWEFDTKDESMVGTKKEFRASFDKSLRTDLGGSEQEWQLIDDGTASLHGLWEITQRKENGNLVQIHQTGTRKTIKILSSTRFQWAAIDPGTKKFMGTGGGTYTFQQGKYTENIEFFSRDSSRVGQSLSFDGKLEGNNWHHSGKSSKGDPIYEVWSRKNAR